MAGINKQKGNVLNNKSTVVQERQIMTRKATLLTNVSNVKRVADKSPGGLAKKRSVLGNLANTLYQGTSFNKKGYLKGQENKGVLKDETKITRNKGKETSDQKEVKISSLKTLDPVKDVSKLSDDPIKDDDYALAISDTDESQDESMQVSKSDTSTESGSDLSFMYMTAAEYIRPDIPSSVVDFDEEMLDDPSSEPHYAADIFRYYKEQETLHKIKKYLTQQPDITKHMRAILVDWIVEVQESFELNHETMYLAIKLVDHYLMKKRVTKFKLQLVGATAVFIACKYDERIPPVLDDFLYICDDAYSRHDIILMEMDLLKSTNFYLGFPLSYRFLRRYARCAKLQMDTLTLARYILETSLMEYDLIDERDSKMAAAALLLALKMKKIRNWDETLQYYSGYKEEELHELMKYLNKMISAPPHKALQCIRTKYSHKIFFEVAKIPPLSIDESDQS